MRTRPLWLSLVLVLQFIIPGAAQQTFKIAKIEFEGLNRLSTDEAIATTNLKTGDTFDLSALDAAAQKLVDSGQFKNVAYRTRSTKDQITITFVVEEAKVATSRVVFDNFVWFTDPELIAAVQREVPSFTGLAPDNGDVVERISKALQRFLHEHQIEATVTYMMSQDAPGSPSEHVFSVNGVPLPICTLHFPGATNISETKLIQSSKELRGNEYSNKFVSMFALKNLIPLYREAGQLKAVFAPPQATWESSANCKGGVDLTLPIDEGHVYKWERAEWTGNKALTSPELDSLLGMQAGNVADGVKIDKSIFEIQKAFGRKGFLFPRMKTVPEFNDDAQKVTYKFSVNEGPQFRMGKLTVKGFSDSETRQINEKWLLKPGAIYDRGYSGEFTQKQISEILREMFLNRRTQGKPAPDLKWEESINREALTVDLTVELKN